MFEPPQRGIGGSGRPLDQFRRDPVQRAMQPLVQGDVNNAQAAADQHQEDFVLRNVA